MSTQFYQQNCTENDNYCKYGAQTLIKLLPTLEAQTDGVTKGEDIECLHKMRVTSRRIRAAMPLFKNCYLKKTFKKWLTEIKKVTRFLGEARDLDVQIIFLQNYLKNQSPLNGNTGVKLLLQSLSRSRTIIQKTVVKELEELKNSGVLEEIQSVSNKMLEKPETEPRDQHYTLEEASHRISAKLDKFLSMENCVQKEEDILGHHQMRIRAKWLRYTMEAFAPLYKDRLSQEIELIKHFQDVLGEMHDCDVWSQCVPKFVAQIEKQKASKQKTNERKENDEKSLSDFTEFVKERRKKYYKDFVQLWGEKTTQDLFEQLRRTTSTEPINVQDAARNALLNPDTKIAMLADVHGNIHALKAVFQDAQQKGISVFLNAGDLTGFGVFPNEVINLLNSKKTASVIGNFDLEVLEKQEKGNSERKLALKYTRKELNKPNEDYLRSLPREITFEIANKKLLMVHGSPTSIDEHIHRDTPTKRLRELAKIAEADVIIVGHSHEQFLKEICEVSFLNPGSVGRPYDENPKAAYAIVGFNPLFVEFVRVDYEMTLAAQAMRKKNMPESFAQMLLRGLSLDAITKEDLARKLEMEQNCPRIKSSLRKVAQKYQQDQKHSKQVRRISLKIFDDLKDYHHLNKPERCWLECAALLHDIGLSIGTCNHNKSSLKLILNDTQIPFASVEKRIIGSIARYHRGSLPKETHYNLSRLNKETKLKIKMLSSILRVADGLDYTHQSIVDQIEVKVDAKKISAECEVHANPLAEEQAVNKKKDLIEKVFQRKLVLTWKKNSQKKAKS